MVPSCITWTQVEHICSLMLKLLAVVAREPNSLYRKLTTRALLLRRPLKVPSPSLSRFVLF